MAAIQPMPQVNVGAPKVVARSKARPGHLRLVPDVATRRAPQQTRRPRLGAQPIALPVATAPAPAQEEEVLAPLTFKVVVQRIGLTFAVLALGLGLGAGAGSLAHDVINAPATAVVSTAP